MLAALGLVLAGEVCVVRPAPPAGMTAAAASLLTEDLAAAISRRTGLTAHAVAAEPCAPVECLDRLNRSGARCDEAIVVALLPGIRRVRVVVERHRGLGAAWSASTVDLESASSETWRSVLEAAVGRLYTLEGPLTSAGVALPAEPEGADPWPWLTGGVAVALVAGGVTFGVLRGSAIEDLRASPGLESDRIVEIQGRAETFSGFATAAWIGAAVAAVSTLVLLAVEGE